MVILQREPTNQYDSNAIQVLNVSGVQIGHIPRAVASKLTPFMDARKLLCEAETTGPKGAYDVPISIKLLGTNDPSARAVLKDEMKAVKLPVEELLRQEKEEKAREKARLAAKKEQEKITKAAKKAGMGMPASQGQSLFREGTGDFAGGSSQVDLTPSLADIMKDSVRFNPRNVDQMVEQFGMKDDDLAKMDKADQPTMVKTQLLPYQLQVRHFPALRLPQYGSLPAKKWPPDEKSRHRWLSLGYSSALKIASSPRAKRTYSKPPPFFVRGNICHLLPDESLSQIQSE